MQARCTVALPAATLWACVLGALDDWHARTQAGDPAAAASANLSPLCHGVRVVHRAALGDGAEAFVCACQMALMANIFTPNLCDTEAESGAEGSPEPGSSAEGGSGRSWTYFACTARVPHPVTRAPGFVLAVRSLSAAGVPGLVAAVCRSAPGASGGAAPAPLTPRTTFCAPSGLLLFPSAAQPDTAVDVTLVQHFVNVPPAQRDKCLHAGLHAGTVFDELFRRAFPVPTAPTAPLGDAATAASAWARELALKRALTARSRALLAAVRAWPVVFRDLGVAVSVDPADRHALCVQGMLTFTAADARAALQQVMAYRIGFCRALLRITDLEVYGSAARREVVRVVHDSVDSQLMRMLGAAEKTLAVVSQLSSDGTATCFGASLPLDGVPCAVPTTPQEETAGEAAGEAAGEGAALEVRCVWCALRALPPFPARADDAGATMLLRWGVANRCPRADFHAMDAAAVTAVTAMLLVFQSVMVSNSSVALLSADLAPADPRPAPAGAPAVRIPASDLATLVPLVTVLLRDPLAAAAAHALHRAPPQSPQSPPQAVRVPNFDSISVRGTPLFPNWYRLSRLRGVVQMPLVTVCKPRAPAAANDDACAQYLLGAASFDPDRPMLYTVRVTCPQQQSQQTQAQQARQQQQQKRHTRPIALFDLPDHILYYLLMRLDVPSLTAFSATCRRAQALAARVFSHMLTRGTDDAPARTPSVLARPGRYVPLHQAWLERRPRIYRLPPAHTGPVRVMLADATARMLVTGSLDRRVKIWVRRSQSSTSSQDEDECCCCCCCPYVDAGTLAGPNAGVAGARLAAGAAGATVLTVGFRNGVVRTWTLPADAARMSAEALADAAAHSYGDTTAPWEAAGECQRAALADGFDFSARATTLLWASRGFVLDNRRAGAVVACLGAHTKRFTGLGYVPGARETGLPLLLSSSLDGTCRLWDTRLDCARGSAAVFRGHSAGVHRAVFLDAHTFATASSDASVMVWDVRRSSAHARALVAHAGPVRCLHHIPGDGGAPGTLLSGSDDCLVTQWSAADMTVVQQFRVHTSSVSCVAGDAHHLFCASIAGTVCGIDFS